MKFKPAPMALAVIAATAAHIQTAPAYAQEGGALEEIIITGSRSQRPRSVADSPVPVDVFSAEDFNAGGNTADITDNLRSLVPSFTATPATGDGSAFVRPVMLRGMAPDQTLILVNGKRRHRSALLHFFAPVAGNGAHAPDVGMIPSIALKSVEVLRDGAAAQYGSDAIAGVINFKMKDNNEGGTLQATYGETFEDEENKKIAGNIGFSLGGDGFLSLSGEWWDNDPMDRAILREDAAALIAEGKQGIGADTPFDDEPLTQSWGRPESEGVRLFFNSGYTINDTTELYAFGNYADTDGTYRFFYRNPEVVSIGKAAHPSLQQLQNDFGYTGALLDTGYTPILEGDQEDYSFFAGIRGDFAGEWFYDFSAGTGYSEIYYDLNNALNPDLGLGSDGEPLQRNFDVGGFEQEETTINFDVSRALSDTFNLALGAEWHDEEYTAAVGEPSSYFLSGLAASGFTSPNPQTAGSWDRDNWAVYVDIEHDISDELLFQYAVRYEDFSDFGDTTNGKFAFRWSATDWLNFRGAVSTGFHAPTPAQSNITTINTTFDGTTGAQVEEKLLPPTDPVAVSVGGKPLEEEESTNYSIGFTAQLGEFTELTVDAYRIEVDGRIYKTGDIQVGVDTIAFYTNAMDTESDGVDIVLTRNQEWNGSWSTDFSLAMNFNDFEVTDQALVNGSEPVSDANVEDIENNFPDERFVFSALTRYNDNWRLLVRANYYGEHYDERGTINDPVSPSAEIDSIIFVDMELSYDFNENLTFTLGGVNVFDEYPDEIGPPNANRLSVGLPYPRRTPVNYEGGSWYLRGVYNF